VVITPAGLSRRRLLEAGALAGTALLLGGCGHGRGRPGRDAETAVLRGLLAREAAVVAALGPAAEGLVGARGRRARRLLGQDRLHLAALSAALGTPATAAPSPVAPAVPEAALAVALARKEAALAAYVDALPRLGDGDLRVTVMQIAAAEAEHAAVLRLLLGRAAAPDAFAGLA